ncbi:MAG TPA: GntR family transcriptional regulator, partial [Acidimicrobiales bacterium]|nr:GntR family transcriptional regulator [Acidimicrobiales bacterium]
PMKAGSVMFVFRLDARSGVPPYLQMVQQVRQAVLLGHLREGDQLPLIREAVEQLAINPNTVSKAYRQLEQEGLVTAKPGVGTFITGAPRSTVSAARYASLRRGFERWLGQAREAGLDDEAITALVAVVRRDIAEEGAA